MLTLTRPNLNPIPLPDPSFGCSARCIVARGALGRTVPPLMIPKVRWTESDGRRLRVASDAARALAGRAGCPCTVQLGLEFVFGPPSQDLRPEDRNAFASAQATAVTPSANEHRAELESQSDLRSVLVASATVSQDGSTAPGGVLLQLESAG